MRHKCQKMSFAALSPSRGDETWHAICNARDARRIARIMPTPEGKQTGIRIAIANFMPNELARNLLKQKPYQVSRNNLEQILQ